jgi:hypothetical protein
MKQAVDLNGIEISVEDSTPVKTVNGVHYLLTEQDNEEVAAREAEYIAKASERQIAKIHEQRIKEYGTMGEQFDLMYHEGFEAWENHITQVKINNPLPI